MAEFETVRNIVLKGVLVLTEEERECVSLDLYSQVERYQPEPYQNYKYPFPEGFYGYWQAVFRGYVVHQGAITQQSQRLFHQNNDVISSVLLNHCWHTNTYSVANRLASTFNLQDQPDQLPYELFLTRFDIEYFAFQLVPGVTLQVRAIGTPATSPCDITYEWGEPPGPPRNFSDPYRPLPPTDVPVNPKDPNGWDLPDKPYNRETDDSGRSYDPPRPDDLPSGTGPGPWEALMSYQGRSVFPPFPPEGEPYETVVSIGNGSPNVNSPSITEYVPGPGGWNAIAKGSYTNSVGNTVNFELNGRRQAYDELLSVSLRKV